MLITARSGTDIVFSVETGGFKYCEYHNKIYRCCIANEPREGMPNSRAEPAR